MSFSKDVKKEIANKCFTLKRNHSKISNGVFSGTDVQSLAEAFIERGQISDPQKMYLLEFVLSDRESTEKISGLLRKCLASGDRVKQTERKGSFVVYVQDADLISDFLAITGAHSSLLEFENMRILKEMRSSIQRSVNCETANIRKTVGAAVQQIADIEYIENNIGFEKLSDELREIAEIRLARPDATLNELAESVVPPVTRSGVNHRLRKLKAIAEEHRKAVGTGVV